MPIFLGMTGLLISSGCEVSTAKPSVAKTDLDPAHVQIDAGVVFSDRASYLCFPLSRFGISRAENIEAVDSSCDCLKPSIVRYPNTSATVADGLLFEFPIDYHTPNEASQPMHLGVEVNLRLVTGNTLTVTVNFLHAPFVGNREL